MNDFVNRCLYLLFVILFVFACKDKEKPPFDSSKPYTVVPEAPKQKPWEKYAQKKIEEQEKEIQALRSALIEKQRKRKRQAAKALMLLQMMQTQNESNIELENILIKQQQLWNPPQPKKTRTNCTSRLAPNGKYIYTDCNSYE